MATDIKKLVIPLFITIVLQIFLEIFSTSIFPFIGLRNFSLPFSLLLVLFLGFRLQTPYLAILIIVLQYFHSFFSIEGWELGTIAGVMICVLISYLRDIIHFSSTPITILVTELFQLGWFFIVSLLLYFRSESLEFILSRFWRFIPESLVLSILAPFLFKILQKIWNVDEGGMLGEKN